MNGRFPHLMQRLINVPIAITPEKAEMIFAALAERVGITQIVRMNGQTVALNGAAMDGGEDMVLEPDGRGPPKGYDTVAGIAVISVEGTLVHKLGTLRPYSGMTGYDGIRQNLLTALADRKVEAVVLDIDSNGGEVAGCFDLCDMIYRARGQKPIWAVLSEKAYSAAYAIASSTDRVIVPRTGGTGSIGVICMHVDFSQMLERAGITVTLLKYGEYKDDGNDVSPLSKGAYDRAMRDIDGMGRMFDALVARNRGIPEAKVRALKAGTFMGKDGVAAGLADTVMAPDAAMRALIATL